MSTDITSETAIFERIVLPNEPGMSHDAARFILSLTFGAEDQQRLTELAQKAQLGTLSEEERRAAESFEHVGHYLAILQAKARRALSSSSGSA